MAGAKKNRCTFKECQLTAQRIVGDCGFCQGHFCSKHRLLEDHKCEGLEDVGGPDLDFFSSSASSTSSTQSPHTPRGPQWWLCKKQSHERNAAQLESERTQVIKGV